MNIRKYTPADLAEIIRLFYDTVHTVNAGDYTKEQLDAWADGSTNREAWNRSFLEHTSLVAVEGGIITGFGDMDSAGYLDRLYVHKDFQRRGTASALCDALEQSVDAAVITTHASVTAKPFFEKRGYHTVKEQQVERKGVLLTNYVMEKKQRPILPGTAT